MNTIDKINALLPQTQCQRCDYAGCKPYAKAITQGEKISRCAPGGIAVLEKLAQLLHQDPSRYYAEVTHRYTPPSLAFIKEEECIGCTKCLQVCPTDAIVGSSKMIHTVIARDCTGCGLCLPACPVDCINMNEEQTGNTVIAEQSINKRTHFKARYEQKQQRLTLKKHKKKLNDSLIRFQTFNHHSMQTKKEKMLTEIQQAVLRSKMKKNLKNN